MCAFKHILTLAGCMLLLLGSCKLKTLPFDFTAQTENNSRPFFRNLPGLSKTFETDTQKLAFSEIRSITVYRSSFTEKWVESSNLVEFALLNDRDSREAAYDDGTRNKYKMYLLVLNTDKKGWDTTNASIVQRQPCLFFTEQQNAGEKCIGFGPVYFGGLQSITNRKTHAVETRIDFQLQLAMQYDKDAGCYVLEEKSSLMKYKSPLTYILDARPEPDADLLFGVTKIVLPLESHIGGGKRVVIPVDSVMGKGLSLPFNYINTIPVK